MEKQPSAYQVTSEQFTSLKSEVDAIQISLMKENEPWYRSPSMFVSILALVLSIVSTAFSIVTSYSDGIQKARSELLTVLQRITAIQVEHTKLAERYRDQQDTIFIDAVGRIYAQENNFLVGQAVDIARNRLGAGRVQPSEYNAISYALSQNYNYGQAIEFANQALENSDDLNNKIASLRGLARLHFITGDLPKGRNYYEKALDVFSQSGGFDHYTQAMTHFDTELDWAIVEANLGNTTDKINIALEHVSNAEKHIERLPLGQFRQQLNYKLQLTKSTVLTIPSAQQ